MKKYFSLFTFCFLLSVLTKAQTQFFSTVKIEFEKTIAQHAMMKELDPEWFEFVKGSHSSKPRSVILILLPTAHILFTNREEKPEILNEIGFTELGAKNVVYTDFQKNSSISQKPIYEETFLVQDSLLKIKWKITADTRNIAGFQCRKAVGILFDTVAVFAFYSDELMIPGGPEGIHGLPGMILGMGIPRLHATWFATKVQVVNVPTGQIHPAMKGKKTNRKEMSQCIIQSDEGLGCMGQKNIIDYADIKYKFIKFIG